jgi:pyruvate formate lyase activating enzyme
MISLPVVHEALLYTELKDKRVQCNLCPRRCVIGENKTGFCKVRKNENGRLYSLTYGKAVCITEEFVETEAVFHFEPGARILSLGNVGCNLDCDYCQNWKFAQLEYVDPEEVFDYSPQQIVDIALEKGIKILSWTYNEPSVWFEFILDTGRLAKKHGLLNLFKSAFFLTPEAIDALFEVIDIFSVSLKAINPETYSRITKGWLEPVLDGTKQVFDKGYYLEISNLIVTELNDKDEDYLGLIDWVINNLSCDIPIHFVRFRPAYKYTHVDRTPLESVERAWTLAKQKGIKHCYLGNVFSHQGLNTFCPDCNNLLVERIGLNTRTVGLKSLNGLYICNRCKTPTNIRKVR